MTQESCSSPAGGAANANTFAHPPLHVALLLLNACGASSTPNAYTKMRAVTAISAKVAAHYGEANPKNMKVSATLTEGSRAVSMNLVALDG
jgi:hypothetical protein